jgi:hypothetical protein
MLMHRTRDSRRETVFFLQTVRNQLGKHVFFANRIDRGTSGMVVMSFDGPTAAKLQAALASPEASKECAFPPQFASFRVEKHPIVTSFVCARMRVYLQICA